MAFLLYFTAVILSGIAAYYSVIGLVAIFSAAAIPVAVMGGSLEAAKLVVASWLYRQWKNIPLLMKVYFVSALGILMLITSMGIFGFLSKAHSDQSLVSGDVASKIAIYDDKIKTAKDNIDANRKALKQMDEAVDQVMGRSTTETGADKAVAIRRSQQKERARLLSEIAAEQKTISQINEERAPIAAEVRKVEAEVGPLKYIAAFIYGDNPDENSLERSVRWLIILLICVFDPLAVLMLIAANLTQIKTQEKNKGEQADDKPIEVISNQTELPVVAQTPEQPKALAIDATEIEPVIEPAAAVETVGVKPSKKKTAKVKPKKEPEVEIKPEILTFGIDAIERPGDYITPSEQTIATVKVEEQTADDKSVSQGLIGQPITVDSEVEKMIVAGDEQGLEQVYKKIVKELAKTKRNKTTHWGPLKNNKNG
jgi:hypothetical protein